MGFGCVWAGYEGYGLKGQSSRIEMQNGAELGALR